MTPSGTPRDRLLAFAGLQTVAVALLAGATGALTDTAPLLVTGHPVSVAASGPAGAATAVALQWLVLVGVVLAAGPVTSVYRARRADGRVRTAVWAVAAVAGLAVVLWVVWVVAAVWSAAGAAAVLAACVASVVVGYRAGTERSDGGPEPPDATRKPPDPHGWLPGPGFPGPALLGPLAGVVLVAAVLAVPASVPGQHDALVESRGFSAPAMDWEFDYEPTGGGRGVVTITHGGGDVVEAGALFLRGRGFAAVPGANQTAPGQWQGTREPDGTVLARDSVTVGVRSDCHLRLVWDGLVAIGEYTCPGGR